MYYGQEFTYALNPIAKHVDHAMDIWCNDQKIVHRLIPPGVKELNGKVERSHKIDEQYFYWKAPTTSLNDFNGALVNWPNYYNYYRIHGGIGFLTPYEKLTERYDALKKQSLELVDAKLEKMRIKFLKAEPTRRLSQDEQIIRLEKQLKSLFNQAA